MLPFRVKKSSFNMTKSRNNCHAVIKYIYCSSQQLIITLLTLYRLTSSHTSSTLTRDEETSFNLASFVRDAVALSDTSVERVVVSLKDYRDKE